MISERRGIRLTAYHVDAMAIFTYLVRLLRGNLFKERKFQLFFFHVVSRPLQAGLTS